VQPEIVITPVPERAAELGVPTEALSAATRIATSGDVTMNLPKFNLPERQVPIRALNDEARGDIESIRSMLCPAARPLPLENIASVHVSAPARRASNAMTALVTSPSPPTSPCAARRRAEEVEQIADAAHLPDGVQRRETATCSACASSSRSSQRLASSALHLRRAVLLFHDFIQPLTILGALPASVWRARRLLLWLWVGRCRRSSAAHADGHRHQELDPAGRVRGDGTQRYGMSRLDA